MEQLLESADTAIAVVNGTEAYYEDIQRLCDERYGARYISRENFALWLQNARLMKIALVDGVFAGFAVMLPASIEEIMTHMAMPEVDVRRISGNQPALIYKSAAVEKKYEHCGIMKAMAAQGLSEACQMGYGSIYGSAWVIDGKIPIEGTFRAFGFQRLYERPMLWYHDENYRCIICKGRCTCDAVIYYKKL